MMNLVHAVLSDFTTITLEEMDAVKLMDRTDTKFVLHSSLIPSVLQTIQPYYNVLNVNNNIIGAYTTRYFDTEDLEMYRLHQNGKSNRIKIRQRDYVNDHVSFLEVKNKTNTGRTIKKRILIDVDNENEVEQNDYLLKRTGKDLNNLSITLVNHFNRITLVHKHLPERATIDFNIQFSIEDKEESPDYLSIIEIKQNKAQGRSELYKHLFIDKRIKPDSMSKYCLGIMLLHNHVKQNRFKEKLIHLHKLQQHGTT